MYAQEAELDWSSKLVACMRIFALLARNRDALVDELDAPKKKSLNTVAKNFLFSHATRT